MRSFLSICTAAQLLATGLAAPALCPAESLIKCANHKLEKCTPGRWHGIDSLEEFEVALLNSSHLSIKSLNSPKSFEDTVGKVIIRDLNGNPVNPEHCVQAPPAPTGEGNCTTHVEAFFSDANNTLHTAVMQSCGILSWLPSNGGTHLYGQWVHANEPTPSPKGAMCDWQPNYNLYREIGTNYPNVNYFTLENIRVGATVNETVVKVHSVNSSFPDVTAHVREVGMGTPGKIAWSAKLFDGQTYRGIMRANSAGGPACCEVETDVHTGLTHLKQCPVISWWSPSGKTSCWAPVNVPSEPIGACGE